MRRRTVFTLACVALATPLLLAGCGSDSATEAFPAASGSYGDKPTLTFPGGSPKQVLHSKVLEQGSGPVVQQGDLLAFDYLAQIWRGKVFDNSYDRHQPLISQIGTGQLIPGWDKSLVGAKVGSRMILVVPPKDGYGTQGNSQAGIKGTDTLVFVVDIVDAYGKDAGGDPHATVVGHPPKGITVTGPLGGEATVKLAKHLAEPKKKQMVILARGSGEKIKKGQVVVQYAAVDWKGSPVQSTWKTGHPVAVGVATPGQASPLDRLVGVPVGSRVLFVEPANGKQPAVAVVVDVVAQPAPAAETTNS